MSDPRQNPILSAWAETLPRRGANPAIADAEGHALRTFWDIENDTASVSRALKGVRPRSVIAVQLGNSPLLPAVLLALWREDHVPVLLDRSVERAAREAAMGACRASGLISTGPDAPPSRSASFRFEPRDGAPIPSPIDFLKLTSGTSGAPRAIAFTAAQLLADCHAVCDTMGITSTDVNYGVIPWSHSYGFSNLVTPLLCRGVPVVATEDRLPRAILRGLASSGATVFPGLPVFYQKLAELNAESLGSLRLCISAGAPLPRATATAFRSRFGLKARGFYGSSECGGIAYDGSGEDVPEGCVGEAMRGVHLEHDEASGRIVVHSEAVGLGYFPEPDLEVLGEGRFAPSDLLQRGPHGFVIAGRVSDFINIAGRKLNPVEVEQVLRGHPGVKDVMVFGVPHPVRGEEPVACVVSAASAQELQSHCARSLAPWQTPREYWAVETLPINERGKCSRRALAELYARRATPA